MHPRMKGGCGKSLVSGLVWNQSTLVDGDGITGSRKPKSGASICVPKILSHRSIWVGLSPGQTR